uniref:Uncharacterized protein n=1 Tax=Nelumbo nucifera TaxID=4432 RepID=A0A822Z8Q9_NELNU|nr:TPA_asm: hypothetical protein HUJ06_014168 [Nelumbo nucifera]
MAKHVHGCRAETDGFPSRIFHLLEERRRFCV